MKVFNVITAYIFKDFEDFKDFELFKSYFDFWYEYVNEVIVVSFLKLMRTGLGTMSL